MATCTPSAHCQSEHMARLVKVPGIVISASGVRAKATRITLQCRSCRTFRSNIAINPGLEGYSLPRKCDTYVHQCSIEGHTVLRVNYCLVLPSVIRQGGQSALSILSSLYLISASVWTSR